MAISLGIYPIFRHTHVITCYTHCFENHKLSKFGRGGPGAGGLRLEEPLQLGGKSGAPPKPGLGADRKLTTDGDPKRWKNDGKTMGNDIRTR